MLQTPISHPTQNPVEADINTSAMKDFIILDAQDVSDVYTLPHCVICVQEITNNSIPQLHVDLLWILEFRLIFTFLFIFTPISSGDKQQSFYVSI